MSNSDIKILLDTNVVIQSEDNRKIKTVFADLQKKCQQFGIKMFIHEASIEDINRDKDNTRKSITLSKLSKYQKLEDIPCPPIFDLERLYGSIKNDNDNVDVRLLHTLRLNVINLLVTEDIGLHDRAQKADLSDRVLFVAEVLEWIKNTFEPTSIQLQHIKELGCHQVDINDDIFSSLKEDYQFEDWFNKTCVPKHRKCWTVNDQKKILAIAIWKDENGEDFKKEFLDCHLEIEKSEKVLKICTFKVHDDARGSKIGEHLLKQALWYAYTNKYDWVYLTAFESKQSYLVSFLKNFGFSNVGIKNTNEAILAKKTLGHTQDLNGMTPLEFHKKFYPHFYDRNLVKKFIIPIEPRFHLKLFPEYTPLYQHNLFNHGVTEQVSGNAIKKVYLCRSKIKKIKEGDIVLFYMSKDANYAYSQSLTIIGVVDGITDCSNIQDLMQVTAKRSVYSHKELTEMFIGNDRPVTAIDFSIAAHLKGETQVPLNLEELITSKIIKSHPQSIIEIQEESYLNLKSRIVLAH